jgi:hypothetical protein
MIVLMNFIRRVKIIILILILTGCAPGPQKPARICPGKNTVEEAIAALNAHGRNIKPFRASGQCLLHYSAEGKDHKENFPVKIWTNPPSEIYLQGDIAFDAAGMVFGSNAGEFWFWLKPKEISSYWWGSWANAGKWNGFIISPEILLEASAGHLTAGDWSLTHGKFDILWLHDSQGVLLKRVYVDTCDYFIAKIEYLDPSGKITASAEFSDYKKMEEGFFVPAILKIHSGSAQDGENSAKISLSSINLIQLNPQQRTRLFVRPKPRGFEHTYQVINGRAVEQAAD